MNLNVQRNTCSSQLQQLALCIQLAFAYLCMYETTLTEYIDPLAALLIFEGGLHTTIKGTGNGWDSSTALV